MKRIVVRLYTFVLCYVKYTYYDRRRVHDRWSRKTRRSIIGPPFAYLSRAVAAQGHYYIIILSLLFFYFLTWKRIDAFLRFILSSLEAAVTAIKPVSVQILGTVHIRWSRRSGSRVQPTRRITMRPAVVARILPGAVVSPSLGDNMDIFAWSIRNCMLIFETLETV